MDVKTSAVLGFGVAVNFGPLLNKFICRSVNGLDERLIILGVTFALSSRFDSGLGEKMLILAGSMISFLIIRYNDSCLIVFLLVSLRTYALFFRKLLIRIVGVCLAHIFQLAVLTGCFCICFW